MGETPPHISSGHSVRGSVGLSIDKTPRCLSWYLPQSPCWYVHPSLLALVFARYAHPLSSVDMHASLLICLSSCQYTPLLIHPPRCRYTPAVDTPPAVDTLAPNLPCCQLPALWSIGPPPVDAHIPLSLLWANDVAGRVDAHIPQGGEGQGTIMT